MAKYDKYYQEKQYFGNPYPELIQYISDYNRDLSVLDLGCGQGRDAIAIARLGFSVTGVDVSKVGIAQMMEVVNKESLDVTGKVSDMKDFSDMSNYNIVLMDSMFHFYKNDLEKETEFLNQIIESMKDHATIIIIVQDSKQRRHILKNIFNSSNHHCQINHEEAFIYKEFNSQFYMIVAKKI